MRTLQGKLRVIWLWRYLFPTFIRLRTIHLKSEMGNLTRIEQETIINFNVAESDAVVYIRDKAVMRKLDALVNEFPEVYKCLKGTDIDKTYSMPKKYVSYRKPRRISEKRREEIRERMKKLNNTFCNTKKIDYLYYKKYNNIQEENI